MQQFTVQQLGKKKTSGQLQQQFNVLKMIYSCIRIYMMSSAVNCLLQTSGHGSIITHNYTKGIPGPPLLHSGILYSIVSFYI